jgi:hypothetical protein
MMSCLHVGALDSSFHVLPRAVSSKVCGVVAYLVALWRLLVDMDDSDTTVLGTCVACVPLLHDRRLLSGGWGKILTNFTARKEGELSAYSVFNKDFKELPGTLSATSLQVRGVRTMGKRVYWA